MRITFFGLTGYGNPVLESLIRDVLVKDLMVITRAETRDFPCYECEHVTELCDREGVNYTTDMDMSTGPSIDSFAAFDADLIIVASFHLVIPSRVRNTARICAVNIHPSLLPSYRGPMPSNWAIIHDEQETGVTFHILTEELDMGDILVQECLSIGNSTDGELRRELAGLAGLMVGPFIRKIVADDVVRVPQRAGSGSYFPKLASRWGMELLNSRQFQQRSIDRGTTPYPGTAFLHQLSAEETL